MAGGKFFTKNKVLSGFYFNVESKKVVNVSTATRGVVAYCDTDPTWIKSGIHRITPDTNTLVEIGFNSLEVLDYMFMGNDERAGASEVLYYIPETTGGSKATITTSDLTITALYDGTRGNDLVVKGDYDSGANEYTIKVYLDGALVEKNKTSDIASYQSNYISLSGTLTDFQAVQLAGGTNGTLASTYYADFLSVLETYRFNVLCYDGNDASTKALVSNFLEVYRDDLGRCCRGVVIKYSADYERITSVDIDYFKLADGTQINPNQISWWVAGLEAGCKGNEDLGNQVFPNAVAVSPRLNDDEQIEKIQSGQLTFIEEYNEVKILSDINTLTTFTAKKGKTWSYNELIRTIDEIGNDWHLYFTKYYNSKVNGVDAESVAKAYVKDYLNRMIDNKYISEYEVISITYNNTERYTSIDFYIKKAYSPDKVYCQLYV